MIESEEGNYELSPEEWALECLMMEVHACADLRAVLDSYFDRAVAETKVKHAVGLARSGANGDADRLEWLDQLQEWFLEANAKAGEARLADMQDLRAIVEQSFPGFNMVATYDLKDEQKH